MDAKTPRPVDTAGAPLLYNGGMNSVYLADAHPDERSALRLLLLDLNLRIVGEAADWPTAVAQAPSTHPDMLVVDGDLVNGGLSGRLSELRQACPASLVVVLINHLDEHERAEMSTGLETFISKGETSERIIERMQLILTRLRE
jgi:DNA-binding NarL/FixJ family response regulator